MSDDAGAALPGATVKDAKGEARTQTNDKGEFTIKAKANKNGKAEITISYVNFKTQTITSDGKAEVNVSMASDVSQGDDVVVIGYQTVKRKDLMASVASVGAKDLKDIPVNSAAEALNGRLAGVTATTAEGSPDADIRVTVRGGMSITQDNAPLYIIDGVQVENGLSSVSPQDILSIDVLKDAAATAIYGARGANGVVIITTKSGKPGKLRVGFNSFVGVKTLANKLDVLDPYEFVMYQYERSRGNVTDSGNFAKSFGTTWDTLNVYKDINEVDWQDEVMGRTGVMQTHNLTISGGSKGTVFTGSYTYNGDKAILLNSKYRRHLANLKIEQKITKDIKFSVSGRYNNVDVVGAGTSDDRSTSYNRLRNTIKYRPFLSPGQDVDDNDPLADDNVGNGLSLINPIQLANAEYKRKSTEQYNITAALSYKIIKNLSFKSTFGYDYTEQYNRLFSDSITGYATTQGDKKPIITLDTTTRKIITNSNTLNYSLQNFKKDHDIDVLIGQEIYQLETHNYGRTVKGFPLYTAPKDAFDQAGNYTLVGVPRNYKSKYTSASFFGRVTYGFKDKYLLSFNMRADGASKFGPGNKWGYFSAGSFAWRVKNEAFMKDVNAISDLKLRIGYGGLGNNRIDDYLYLTTFRNDQYYYGIGGDLVQGYSSVSLVNSNLKWESMVNRNLGLDISFFKNRLNFVFDYYRNTSKDLLVAVNIASTYGYEKQIQNVGKTLNRGFEMQINGVIMQKPNGFNWNANFNFSTNKNTVEALAPGQTQFYPDPSWGVSGQPTDYIVKVGAPVGSMYGLVTDGFYKVSDFNYDAVTKTYTLKSGVVNNTSIIGAPQPGSIKFKDIDGDGLVTLDNDRTIIGNPTPKFTGGLNQQFSYKNWDASVFVNWSVGNDIYNANKIELTNGYSTNSNMLEIMKDRWRTVDASGNVVTDPAALEALNANAKIWKPIVGAGAFYPHSWAIEDGSFLRLNNITVGYTFPVKTLTRLKMSKLRLYATASNLAVITGYSGYDPEVSVRRSGLTPGLDYSAYPKSRTYIFGVNVMF